MDFDFDQDQYMLRDSVRCYLSDAWGPRMLRAADGAHAPELWSGLCGLGLQTLPIAEAYGGAGLGWVDLVLVLEEFGRALVPPPMADTLLAADVIGRHGTAQQRDRLLAGIAAGSCRFAFAHVEAGADASAASPLLSVRPDVSGCSLHGTKILVAGAQAATHLIVSGTAADGSAALYLCAADESGLTITPHRAVDPSALLCRVAFDGVRGELLGHGPDMHALQRMLEIGTLSAAAQMAGLSAAALDGAVSYAKQRTQFDRPIGSFQAIKHKCADMLVALEGARTLVYHAAWAAQDAPEQFPLAVSMAKAACGDASRLICNDAMQIHGGVGFTWEFDIHLYMKRAKLLEYQFGDASHHRERVARLVIDAAPAMETADLSPAL